MPILKMNTKQCNGKDTKKTKEKATKANGFNSEIKFPCEPPAFKKNTITDNKLKSSKNEVLLFEKNDMDEKENINENATTSNQNKIQCIYNEKKNVDDNDILCVDDTDSDESCFITDLELNFQENDRMFEDDLNCDEPEFVFQQYDYEDFIFDDTESDDSDIILVEDTDSPINDIIVLDDSDSDENETTSVCKAKSNKNDNALSSDTNCNENTKQVVDENKSDEILISLTTKHNRNSNENIPTLDDEPKSDGSDISLTKSINESPAVLLDGTQCHGSQILLMSEVNCDDNITILTDEIKTQENTNLEDKTMCLESEIALTKKTYCDDIKSHESSSANSLSSTNCDDNTPILMEGTKSNKILVSLAKSTNNQDKTPMLVDETKYLNSSILLTKKINCDDHTPILIDQTKFYISAILLTLKPNCDNSPMLIDETNSHKNSILLTKKTNCDVHTPMIINETYVTNKSHKSAIVLTSNTNSTDNISILTNNTKPNGNELSCDDKTPLVFDEKKSLDSEISLAKKTTCDDSTLIFIEETNQFEKAISMTTKINNDKHAMKNNETKCNKSTLSSTRKNSDENTEMIDGTKSKKSEISIMKMSHETNNTIMETQMETMFVSDPDERINFLDEVNFFDQNMEISNETSTSKSNEIDIGDMAYSGYNYYENDHFVENDVKLTHNNDKIIVNLCKIYEKDECYSAIKYLCSNKFMNDAQQNLNPNKIEESASLDYKYIDYCPTFSTFNDKNVNIKNVCQFIRYCEMEELTENEIMRPRIYKHERIPVALPLFEQEFTEPVFPDLTLGQTTKMLEELKKLLYRNKKYKYVRPYKRTYKRKKPKWTKRRKKTYYRQHY